MMNKKLKSAFDCIHAEEELKEKTLDFVKEKTQDYTKTRQYHYPKFLASAACLLLLFLGGRWLYFTPVASISVDVNPSLELGVNRLDKVVSVTGFNEDGETLAGTLDLKYADYHDALDRIVNSKAVSSLLSDDAVMAISVSGPDNNQTEQILSDMESYANGHQNTYCYSVHPDEAKTAHDLGLSCGKYKAYLEMKEVDPDITPEEIQGMTMREIHNCIHGTTENGTSSDTSGTTDIVPSDSASSENTHHQETEHHKSKHRHGN